MDIPRGKAGCLFLVYILIGCGKSLPAPIPPPTPVSTSPLTVWMFNYAPGAMRYQISRSAAIEIRSDSSNGREISTNTTNEIITLAPTGDSGIAFTAVVDAFSTTTQGLIGPVQPVHLPVQLSGLFAGDSLAISNDSANKCNPVSSALLSDLHSLLTRFPAQLSRGLVWRDSVVMSGCQAGVPTTSRTMRSYVVSGEAIYEDRPILLVQRSDIIHAHGEGAQQQHQLTLDAEGTGSAVYYLDMGNGRVARLTAEQELNLTVTTSGKPHRFKQTSRQDFRFTR